MENIEETVSDCLIMEPSDNTVYHSCIAEGEKFIVFDEGVMKSTHDKNHESCVIECTDVAASDSCIMESSEIISVYYIGVESELLFSVGKLESVTLELLSGYAEICGSELIKNKIYRFQPLSSVSVLSWKGCKVRIKGNTEEASVTTDTLTMIPVAIHACLEEMRIIADTKNLNGPTCLVVGPSQSGKSSFCRFLLNYAARMGRKPLFVNLDVAYNPWTLLPGIINVVRVKKPFDVLDDYKEQASSLFNFGYKQPNENVPLYSLLVKKLGQMLVKLMDGKTRRTRHSGLIIDACRYEWRSGYTALTLAASSFQVEVLFVLEDERLYEKLSSDMPSNVQVVYVPKPKNITAKSPQLLADNQDDRVYKYFYGTKEDRLRPFELKIPFSEIEVYRIVPVLYSACDSSGSDVVKPVSVGPKLLHQVLGLSFAAADQVNDILMLSNVKGFVCVIDVDVRKSLLTVLSPTPGPLLSNILVMGNMKLKAE